MSDPFSGYAAHLLLQHARRETILAIESAARFDYPASIRHGTEAMRLHTSYRAAVLNVGAWLAGKRL